MDPFLRKLLQFPVSCGMLMIVLAFPGLSQAQSAQDLPTILSSTRSETLMNMSRELRSKSSASRSLALLKARQFGLDSLNILGSGKIIQLKELGDNGRPLFLSTANLNAAKTISANKVWNGGGMGLNLSGNGVVLRLWDAGAVRLTHQEITGRAAVCDGTTGMSDHSMHVAGTMMASGIVPNAHGMSALSTLRDFDWNYDYAEMAAEAANGMLLSNHSYIYLTGWSWWGTGWVWWGDTTVSRTTDYTFGFYMSDARTVDSIAYLAPYYLVCKAAGNEMFVGPANQPVAHQVWTPSGYYPSTWVRNLNGGPNGYDCISSGFGVSKNILTLGAVNAIPNGYSSPADVVLASFSSTGPTDDGRIKPDLVTDGVGLYSTLTANNTAYGYSSGTSMATPGATGSLALLQEHYHNLHGNYMLASMLRGLAIHTADEAGTAPGPDYRFGWGLLDIAKAATVLSRQCSNAVIRDTLQNGETYILELKTKSSQPLTATLCWTDPPGVPPPNVLNPPNLMLVNDLDMRIDSTVYKPWTLDPANVTAAASTGDNFRDNVEKIVIPNPPTGKHILKITHKNSLSGGSQVFSLIISGIDSVMTPGTAGNPQSVCYNTAPAALSATPPLGGAPPYTYQWQQSNDNVIFLDIPGANALTYQPGPLTGNFWYRLVQTPSGSCQGAITNSVAVLVLPLVVPGITGPSETCVNSTETYSTESGMTDYSWEVSPGNTIVSGAGTNQISVAWNTSGIQWVKVSYTNAAGCSAMAPTQSDILVNPHPPAPVITQNGYVLSSNAPTGNQWYHDGNILPSDTASSMVVSQNGWYWDVVTLDGCSSDSSNNIYVIIESSDDLADDFPGNFTVYPLPGNGDFHIAFSSFPGTRLTAELINSLGQSVRLQTLDLSGTQSSFRLDFRPLPAGLYTLLIRTSETTCTRKVLITK